MNYREIYEKKDTVSLDFLSNEYANISTWDEAYWLGLCAEKCIDESVDRIKIDIIQLSFDLGLNIQSNKEYYLDSLQRISRLYYHYGKHAVSCRMFMILDANDNVPDWVHISYASSQIHTDNIYRIAYNPALFIARLNSIKTSDTEITAQRNNVYREFLILCSTIYEKDASIQMNIDAITRGAYEFELSRSVELKNLISLYRNEKNTKDDESNLNNYENDSKIESLMKELDIKAEMLDDMEQDRSELSKKVDELISKNNTLMQDSKNVELLRQENEQAKFDIEKKDEAIKRLSLRIDELLNQLSVIQPQTNREFSRKKLLVIGDTQVNIERLRGIAKCYGFNKRNIEFWVDYDKLTSKLSSIQYNSSYSGIIIGPTPHKAAGNEGYSSPIVRLKQEGYPHLEEAKSKSGELKITVDTFKTALERMDVYLKSGGVY